MVRDSKGGSGEPMLAKPRHSVLATQLSWAPNPLSLIKTPLRKYSGLSFPALLPNEESYWNGGEGRKLPLCASCFFPALAGVSEPRKKHSLLKVMI